MITNNVTTVETWSFTNGEPSPYNVLNNDSPIERRVGRKIYFGLSELEGFMENTMVQEFIEDEKDRKNFQAKLIGLHWGLLYWNTKYMNYDETEMLRSLKNSTKKLAFQERYRFSFSSLFSEKSKLKRDNDGLYYNCSKKDLELKYRVWINELRNTQSLEKAIDNWNQKGLDPKEKLKDMRDHIVRLYFSLVKYHDYISEKVSIE